METPGGRGACQGPVAGWRLSRMCQPRCPLQVSLLREVRQGLVSLVPVTDGPGGSASAHGFPLSPSLLLPARPERAQEFKDTSGLCGW